MPQEVALMSIKPLQPIGGKGRPPLAELFVSPSFKVPL
jgi:hypothetical protein